MRFITLSSFVVLSLSPAALSKNFAVTVGADNTNTYSPAVIAAAKGDTITFTFVGTSHHSATTTEFTHPCPPPARGLGPNGFDTGVHSGATSTITLADNGTHFVSCMVGNHCKDGMTFAINPTEEMSYAQFLANAKAS